MFFGVLQEESGLSYSACTFNTNQTVVPVYLVHEGATDRSVGMLHKVRMCSEKRLHSLVLDTICKDSVKPQKCKVGLAKSLFFLHFASRNARVVNLSIPALQD